jgi:hypothetical protein
MCKLGQRDGRRKHEERSNVSDSQERNEQSPQRYTSRAPTKNSSQAKFYIISVATVPVVGSTAEKEENSGRVWLIVS